MEFSAHTTRPTFVIDMKTVSFPFLLSISLKLRNTKLLLPQITSFLQLLPLVFLVLTHNIKICSGHHPLPATEKMIRNQMFNINKEAQKDQRLYKEGTMVEVRSKADRQQYPKNLRWYSSLANTENIALDLFFRRFYV